MKLAHIGAKSAYFGSELLVQAVLDRPQVGGLAGEGGAGPAASSSAVSTPWSCGANGLPAKLRHRYLTLLLEALHLPAATPLPGPPPSWEEISRRYDG